MKRKALCMALSVCVLALGGCGGGETDVTETQAPVQTTSAYDTMRQQDPTEAVAETTAPAESETSDEGFVKITDYKDEINQRNLEQAKEGFAKLKSRFTWSSTDAETVLAGFIDKVDMDYSELSQLSQDELYEVLSEAGYSDEQIYCFSVMQWLLEADQTGDEGQPVNYLTNTKALLTTNSLDFDTMLKCRNAEELNLIISDAGLTAEELNAKLYFNSMFPGVDVNAKAILEADNVDDILSTLEEGGLTSGILRDKASAESAESGLFVEQVANLKAEKAAEEAEKNSSSGNSGGSSRDNAQSAVDKDSNTDKSTELPEGADDEIVTVQIGNGGGYVSGPGGTYNENYGGSSSGGSSSTNSKGTANITVDDEEVTVKISVKRVVRGGSAESIIASSNSNLPGSFDVDDLPDGYEPVAVKFTVTTDNDTEATGITVPNVRVRTLGGQNIDTVATRVYLIQPDDENYENETNTKTYWVAFIIPDSQEEFSLYFGDGGETYLFKTTAIDVEGDDDDDDD